LETCCGYWYDQEWLWNRFRTLDQPQKGGCCTALPYLISFLRFSRISRASPVFQPPPPAPSHRWGGKSEGVRGNRAVVWTARLRSRFLFEWWMPRDGGAFFRISSPISGRSQFQGPRANKGFRLQPAFPSPFWGSRPGSASPFANPLRGKEISSRGHGQRPEGRFSVAAC